MLVSTSKSLFFRFPIESMGALYTTATFAGAALNAVNYGLFYWTEYSDGGLIQVAFSYSPPLLIRASCIPTLKYM